MSTPQTNRVLGRSSENDLVPPDPKNKNKRSSGGSPRGSASFDSIELEYNYTDPPNEVKDVTVNPPAPVTTFTPPLSPTIPVVFMRGITRLSKPKLKDFSMTVQQGIIYGLVGPAGCGKSTVLSLIAGIYELRGKTTGTLSILGVSPDNLRSLRRERLQKTVGYMPQEMALYEDLTITETFAFYGRLYGMSRVDVNLRRNFLVQLFDVQVDSRLVGTMSRAEKRIFNLAVTLLHCPQVVLLDEPFAFMDPIAKSKTWNSISKILSQESLTFVIATQSVEDANKFTTVGLMRNGRMLTELSPDELLATTTSSLFSDAVLKVYQSDDSGDTKLLMGSKDDCTVYTWDDQVSPSSRACPFIPTSCLDSSSGRRIQSVLWISLISLMRRWMLTIFLVVCPTLIISIPWTLFKDDIKPLEMGYVNLENPFREPCFRPTNLNNETACDFSRLSCQFLSKLSDSILHLTEYESSKFARIALSNGEIWGFIEFPSKYSEKFQLRNEGTRDNDALQGSNIFVEMDMTNRQVSSTIQAAIHTSYTSFSDELFMACNQESEVADYPIKYSSPVYGRSYHRVEEFLIPGLLVAASYFIPMCSISLQYIRERQLGLSLKTKVAGVTLWEVLISAWAKETILTFFRLGLCLPIIFLGFQIQPTGSLALMIFILLLMSLTGVSVGLVIALICDYEVFAISFAFIPLVQNLLFAGILWPRELTSTAQYYLSSMLPCTLPAEALRSIISRGWDVSYFSVWSGTLYPLLIILFSCALIAFSEWSKSK